MADTLLVDLRGSWAEILAMVREQPYEDVMREFGEYRVTTEGGELSDYYQPLTTTRGDGMGIFETPEQVNFIAQQYGWSDEQTAQAMASLGPGGEPIAREWTDARFNDFLKAERESGWLTYQNSSISGNAPNDQAMRAFATQYVVDSQGYGVTGPVADTTWGEIADEWGWSDEERAQVEASGKKMDEPWGLTGMFGPTYPRSYETGDLAQILQTTPSKDISKRIHELEESGQNTQARATEIVYGNVQRVAEPGTTQDPESKYPLRDNEWDALRTNLPALRTGQRDVRMEPGLVASIMSERPSLQQKKRRYKGGTRTAGLLGTLKLGKTILGA